MLKVICRFFSIKQKFTMTAPIREDNICWYHGKISREAAEQIILAESQDDGTFLVRESSTAVGDYVLSVLCSNEVIHYQIRRHGEDAFFSIDEHTIIHGLETLIEYYQEDNHGLITKLSIICRKDAPPHDSRRHGRTNLLHRATKEGDYTVVSELLKCGYRSLEAKNQDGQTAVHLASRLGKDDILMKLIDSGANVNCRDTAGYTPLHYACQNNLRNTVRILIYFGHANVQSRTTESGWVPLHEAAARGHSEVIRELLSLNAPVNPRTANRETPAQLAQANGHLETARILKKYKTPLPKTRKQDWYHGTLDRNEALSMLREVGNRDGAFLIRYSDRNGGMDVLTMIFSGQPYNFQIQRQGEYYFIDNGPFLESLEHVVDHYSTMSDGLPTHLQTPVPPKPKPPVPEMPRNFLNGLSATLPHKRTHKRSPNRSERVSPASSASVSPSNSRRPSLNIVPNSSVSSSHEPPPNVNGLPPPPPPLKHSISMPLPPVPVVAAPTPPTVPSIITDDNPTIDLTVPKNNELHNQVSSDYIDENCLTIGPVLGGGEFGSVFQGTYLLPSGTKADVAIKTLHKEHEEVNRDEFLREAKVMISLDHHCIVKLIGVSKGNTLLMVQELVPLGSMLEYLIKFPHRVQPNYELKLWASQIACGMKYLEEQRFVHRDLAARNILLASRHQVKISDFGLSRALGGEHEYYRASQGGRWPIKWYSPESYNYGTFSHPSDVWSYGITLWEMFSYGLQPYGDLRGVEVIDLVERGERLEQTSQCPDHVYRIMERCWAYQPRDRPTFRDLMETFSADPEYANIKELVQMRDIN